MKNGIKYTLSAVGGAIVGAAIGYGICYGVLAPELNVKQCQVSRLKGEVLTYQDSLEQYKEKNKNLKEALFSKKSDAEKKEYFKKYGEIIKQKNALLTKVINKEITFEESMIEDSKLTKELEELDSK